jgi:hypothetical protein
MNGGLAALLRYWWVVVIGVGVGIGVAIVATYAKDEPYSYNAETRVLVTSAESPYYRTEVTNTVERSPTNSADPPVVVQTNEPPELSTLVLAANLYPQLVESDLVANLRDKMFGTMTGTVDAKTIFSFEGANRFEESDIPVILIGATAATETGALELSEKTTRAFMSYIKSQQEEADISDSQRVLIQPLTSARITSVTGGPVYGIPFLLGVAVFLGFCGLALLLDAFARRSQLTAAAQAPAPAPAPREERLAS